MGKNPGFYDLSFHKAFLFKVNDRSNDKKEILKSENPANKHDALGEFARKANMAHLAARHALFTMRV